MGNPFVEEIRRQHYGSDGDHCSCGVLHGSGCWVGVLLEEVDGLSAKVSEQREAVKRLASERSDATRLLPLGSAEWQEIRGHLHAWREDEISEARLRSLIVLALRDGSTQDESTGVG